MTTLTNEHPTLVDWAKLNDPGGRPLKIVELMSQKNAVVDDMVVMEGNTITGNITTVRTGLPATYWTLLNQGTPDSNSTEAQATINCGLLTARASVDKRVAALGGNLADFRFKKAKAHFESMAQEMAQTVWYGNSGVNVEEFTGLSVQFSSLSAANGQNIVDAGGTGSDNSSIWLIVWSTETVAGIFPKGSKAGLEHENIGLEDALDRNGNPYRAYKDLWEWKMGVAVMDWRYVVRIANVDISDLVANSSPADMRNLLTQAYHLIEDLQAGTAVIYMNRTLLTMYDIQAKDDVSTGGGLTFENVDGKPMLFFRGIPVRRSDQLLETEARVV